MHPNPSTGASPMPNPGALPCRCRSLSENRYVFSLSGAELIGCEALQAPGQDRDEGDLDESDEVLLCPLEDRVQPTIAAQPGEGALHDPANSGWKEFSIPAAGDRLDGDAERLGNLGQPLAAVAKITQSRSPQGQRIKWAGEI